MSYRPVITTQADVEEMWRFLMGPLGFGRQSLWFVLVAGDGALVPHVSQIDDVPASATDEEVGAVVDFIHELVSDLGDPSWRVAFLRSRPGGRGPTPQDREWASALVRACRKVGQRCEVVHLATDHDVVPLPEDDLMAVPA
ncbi:MAG: hypothetical protein U0R80_16245 [Nocardioidaceae bacterium]